ncbi:long-chain fatty acid--CoA ligase [Microbacterium rhizomatis]|uniref:Long-chain fatty acid--CoA ligase n=1 Tax=Microbacterium rhizomatis TaxID=1631477 RepID=A0A5J5IZM5_9MICO|nr:long-chain fatty acid--CoA ligase [Microbacterium rhizomatis]
MVPISATDPIEAVATLLAVRAASGIGIITDDRSGPDRRARALLCSGTAEAAAVRQAPQSIDGRPAWASFTSGSSGSPRLLLRTDRSWADSFPAVGSLLALDGDDTVLLPAPLSSSLSLFSVAHAAATGIPLRFPAHAALVAEDITDATITHTTPHGLRAIIELIEGGSAHRLRAALVGGDALDRGLRDRAESHGIRTIAYYGAAELSFVAIDVDGRGHRPFPGVDVQIRDGELWVRSPYLALGYLGADGGAFRHDSDGWATVGDRAAFAGARSSSGDDGPRIVLRGRRDAAIQTSSATVIPADVEAALRAVDGVQDAVAFAIPHSRAGSLVGVTVQFAAHGAPLTSADLRDRVRSMLTLTHLPRRWFVSPELPRTPSGKPERSRIRDEALSGRTARLD